MQEKASEAFADGRARAEIRSSGVGNEQKYTGNVRYFSDTSGKVRLFGVERDWWRYHQLKAHKFLFDCKLRSKISLRSIPQDLTPKHWRLE